MMILNARITIYGANFHFIKFSFVSVIRYASVFNLTNFNPAVMFYYLAMQDNSCVMAVSI